jgi:phosphoserine phosphatase
MPPSSSGHGSVTPPDGRRGRLPRVTARELVARLEAERARAGARPALAFDADGTLWSGDVGFDLFQLALAERALRPAARDALAREAHAAGLSAAADDDATALALRLFAAWASGDYGDGRAFRMMAWAFAGWSAGDLLALADQALRGAGLAARVHAPVREVIDWARGAGVEVWIVSASPRAAVEAGGRLLGVPPERVLAVTPRREGEILTAVLEEPVPYDAGKAAAIAAAAPGAALLGAFGDSASDAPLMRAARVAVAVEPHERLRALYEAGDAPSLPHLVELAIDDAPHRAAPKP